MTSLTIKDIAHTEELSAKELSAVRGGSNYNAGNLNLAYGGGFASPGVVVAPVTQTDTHTTVEIPTIQNFGGLQFAKA
ncbi:hypothetical protein [Paraburkholderia rhynchosiae]|uniref:Bacteriocin n=1 Tax=Paraburkholderia rhynchosiae TaxID=487049 RepID=A0A2N7WIR5_9BURK|nr:hypothetical protein [Paraburkholderia rhynchosiae]PMS29318.1 hypothetical protein C0Z16_19335 [Paraburkholderia rhynchosiae]PMS29320.1 hypothetical protein C0Z16_19345 [Paraburkholderia rhynchosiae]CAB3709589.1 hypothetical protein LMG27174_04154 [Paraburkholderia rhynchosiae]CAB3709634.1 hypothetical protein LMG27174_04156 [Paraburkholderia rhynchosiae]